MLIDDLIEKLYELKKEYGNLKVILWAQQDEWYWNDHDIAEVYHDGDALIVIQGKDKTGDKE